MKILLATDGSSCSDAAVNEVASRAWPVGSEVKIVSAVEPPAVTATEPWSIPAEYYAEMEKATHDHAHAAVESAISKLRAGADKSLKITSARPTGSPQQVILEEAERWGADLIVVGSHGYGTWDRFLLGSVSQSVALHAKCSVEIVRENKV
ncbi:MAG TPA: universal stress protein [Pyrinomonadaceae bacterium]|nr:universal stress protein [Pyrinomonadaceae bacterium]